MRHAPARPESAVGFRVHSDAAARFLLTQPARRGTDTTSPRRRRRSVRLPALPTRGRRR